MNLSEGAVDFGKRGFSPVILHPLHRSSVVEAPLEGELRKVGLVHLALKFKKV